MTNVGTRIGCVAAMLVTASMAASLASAQTTRLSFADQLERSRASLRVDADGLHGAGAAVIADAVTKARYVLIGEDHFSREIPRFSAGICRMMAPGGLDAFAVEIGPEVASVVNAALRRPDRIARIAAFTRSHPDAMVFQNGQDESDTTAQCAELAGPGLRIWGLDQEFLGAAGYLLETMLAAHPGPAAHAAINRLLTLDRGFTAAALASGSTGDLFILKVTDQQLAQAQAGIARDGGDRVKALFATLAETRAIYLGQDIDGFASNGQRARLMKHNLVRYMQASKRPVRVLFRFGDVHMAKGVNDLGQRDVGNFVAERADGERAASLHIAVYGLKGVHALYGGVGRKVRQEPFVMTEDSDYAWLKDALPAQDRKGDGHAWTVIDMRALRGRPIADMPTAWQKKVQEFDLLVLAPQLTPSSLIGTE